MLKNIYVALGKKPAAFFLGDLEKVRIVLVLSFVVNRKSKPAAKPCNLLSETKKLKFFHQQSYPIIQISLISLIKLASKDKIKITLRNAN